MVGGGGGWVVSVVVKNPKCRWRWWWCRRRVAALRAVAVPWVGPEEKTTAFGVCRLCPFLSNTCAVQCGSFALTVIEFAPRVALDNRWLK